MNKLMDFCEYMIWMFLGNLFFLLANLPFLFFYFFVGLEKASDYRLLLFVCLLPMGPAFTALLSTMSKLIRYKDVSVFRDFRRAYRANFRVSLGTAAVQLALILILSTNIDVIGETGFGYLFTPFFKILTCLLLLMTFYLYPVISRYHVTIVGAFRTAMILTISKPMVTIGNLVILLFTFVLVELKASYAVLFVVSILCWLIMFFQRPIFTSIEQHSGLFPTDPSKNGTKLK